MARILKEKKRQIKLYKTVFFKESYFSDKHATKNSFYLLTTRYLTHIF